jgi:hypothetical protein
LIFFRRKAASSNHGIKGDGKKPPRLMPGVGVLKTYIDLFARLR